MRHEHCWSCLWSQVSRDRRCHLYQGTFHTHLCQQGSQERPEMCVPILHSHTELDRHCTALSKTWLPNRLRERSLPLLAFLLLGSSQGKEKAGGQATVITTQNYNTHRLTEQEPGPSWQSLPTVQCSPCLPCEHPRRAPHPATRWNF